MTEILSFSLIIWILIDRFKGMWSGSKYKSYITSAIALLMGGAVAVFYQLDIVVALGLSESVSPLGIILTALSLMGGSSCIAEIMQRITLEEKDLTDIREFIGSDADDDEGGEDHAE